MVVLNSPSSSLKNNIEKLYWHIRPRARYVQEKFGALKSLLTRVAWPVSRCVRILPETFHDTDILLALFETSEALEKMKGVYVQNAQLGDPSSLEPQITETNQIIGRLTGELGKYEVIAA